MTRKQLPFLFIVFAFLGAGIFYEFLKGTHEQNIIKMNEAARDFMSQYHFLTKEDSLNSGFLEKISKHGAAYLTINSEEKIAFHGSYNYNLNPSCLCSFLEVGDSIVKPSNSEVIMVYKEGEEYYFKLDGDVMEGEQFPKQSPPLARKLLP
ncbi:hypothetical protein [Ekhidna sp.]|jgi:hypothetical protein|uniref:hypothetical protein n=1 Tax=Ekhidna sp. TaxID=2608089 RepID=UPI0032EF542F